MKNKTTLDANAAKKLLRANWGIKAELSELPSERDVNFKAVGEKTYVLKIYPGVNAILKASLNFQNKVLNFLQDNSIHCAPAVIGVSLIENYSN
jgi:Ser/Thr protein kinase RdoA (MazF antagonist)